jgi:hypothetical protein
MIQYRDGAGALRTVLVEVKPKSQTSPPKRPEGKITRRFITEVKTWGVNESKWKAAVEYCKDRKWEFKIITEKELT